MEKDNMVAEVMGKFQDFLNETHKILVKCSGCRYADAIKTDCEEHKTHLTKVTSILQRTMLEDVPNKDKLPIFDILFEI